MHAADVESGRAIYGGAGSPPANEGFSAKYESPAKGIAQELASRSVPDVRIASALGERCLYSRDQSEIPRFLKNLMFRTVPDAVVQTRSADAVCSVLRYSAAKKVPVVPRGSGSSPFGGSVPVAGGIVIDLSRMDRVLSLDAAQKNVTVEAGIRWADLDGYLERHGLGLHTCPSSKFSTVGGWIATGGYGINSLSKGHLSEVVVSLVLATSDGIERVLTPADPAFASVFGSEGQLGVITSATLAVRKRPESTRPHLVMFGDFRSALSFALAVSESSVRPTHVMLESAERVALANRLLGKEHYRPGEAVLVNVEGAESDEAFAQLLRKTGLKEEKEYLARFMWNERFFPMKIRKLGPGMLGTEVLLPLKLLPEAITRASRLCAQLGLEPSFEVHFVRGERALLLCFFLTDQGNTILYTLDAVKSMLLSRVLVDLGGRPYSIGIWNNPFSDAEDPSRVEAIRAVKNQFDPGGVMNKGKYFSLSGRLGKLGSSAFTPSLMKPVLKALLLLSPITMPMLRMASRFALSRLEPKSRSKLLQTADECAMCGACVSVCPAYLIVGDERVTARGKLQTAKAMASGASISKEHAHRIFLCMRCKACEQICQSKLELASAFDQLEAILESVHGKDQAEIERFIRHVEVTPEYEELIRRGLVIGAPKHGMGGAGEHV